MIGFSKQTLALAISSLLAASANADVFQIYDDNTSPKTAASLNYAKEIKFPTTAPLGVVLKQPNTAGIAPAASTSIYGHDLIADLGWEVAKDDFFYPRFTLENAQFEAANANMEGSVRDTSATISDAANGATLYDKDDVTASVQAISSTSPGGGKGQSYIYYTLKNDSAGTITSTNKNLRVRLSFTESFAAGPTNPNTIRVMTKAPVNVSYALYQTSSGAYAGGTSSALLGSIRSTELLNFNRSAIEVKFEKPANAKTKIDVANASKTFDTALGTDSTKRLINLGKVTVGNSAGIYLVDGTQLATAGTVAIAGTGSTIVVKGDFAAAVNTAKGAAVFLDKLSSDCDSAAGNIVTGSLNTAADTATFVVNNTASGFHVCMKVDGETEINGGQYTATYSPVAVNADYEVSTSSGSLLKLDRNGAILQSPFFNLVPGYVPRFYLTNTGPADAAFSIQLMTDATATGTLAAGTVTSGTIPKGGAILLKADEIATGGQRGAAIFQIMGLDENINGLYQFRNQKTGNFDSIVMPHKAYIYGPPQQ